MLRSAPGSERSRRLWLKVVSLAEQAACERVVTAAGSDSVPGGSVAVRAESLSGYYCVLDCRAFECGGRHQKGDSVMEVGLQFIFQNTHEGLSDAEMMRKET